MAKHVFYPSSELPHQVESYITSLKLQKPAFGDIPANAANDLTALETSAKALVPMADEIEKLQIDLAAKLDAYHKTAAPVWERFSEKLGYARVYAEKSKNAALIAFLKAFRHNEGRHAASKAAQGKTVPTPPSA